MLEEVPDVPVPTDPLPLTAARGEVRFDDVRFEYVPGTAVLPGLDLTVPAGQTLALVGTTGAGKTTVAKAATRFYDPTAGTVTLDGIDLTRLAADDLHRAVIMVTQENYLFSGTVADNIRFGRPDATDDEVEAAARSIGAHDFITALPEGYATPVSNRGGLLSAGQRQARRLRAGLPRRPGGAHPRRGDLVARRPLGAARAAGARHDPRRAHRHRHRAPALDGRDRRPGARARARPHRRGRRAERASSRPVTAATRTCTAPGSTPSPDPSQDPSRAAGVGPPEPDPLAPIHRVERGVRSRTHCSTTAFATERSVRWRKRWSGDLSRPWSAVVGRGCASVSGRPG